MKFVDEAIITVHAGKGGDGCASFRREKYIRFGGPNGGDGGDGGSVYLTASPDLNTLADFRMRHHFEARNGQSGMGKNCSGKHGADIFIRVPVGTLAYDADTNELIADLSVAGATMLVAQGGHHGLGNTHFKSSVNRAPRKFTYGKPGETRRLKLELQLLADVGLLGMPNAGKSSFIRSVSEAKPAVADYPFTTIYPQLGVVQLGVDSSFVIADIPGLIQGAAQGRGLGLQFLRHLERTKLLLHLVDFGTISAQPELIIEHIQQILHELEQYDPKLLAKPRWLVLTKADLLTAEDATALKERIVQELNFSDPVYVISSITKLGVEKLCQEIMYFLTQQAELNSGNEHQQPELTSSK